MSSKRPRHYEQNPTKGEGIIAYPANRKVSRPHEIVERWFPSAFSHYTIEQKVELIDYLYEWGISKGYLSNAKPLLGITLGLEQRFLRDSDSGNSFERYMDFLSREKTTTPEDFMNYFLGEEHFTRLKNQMQSDPEEYKARKKIKIEENIK